MRNRASFGCPSFLLFVCILAAAGLVISGCEEAGVPTTAETIPVELIPREETQQVDVEIGGRLFTSYLYTDTLDILKKPVLYPINTADGMPVTRGYPLDPRPGDRVDHPHHIGYWLNYGVVNGLDYWGHSNSEYSRQNPDAMGTIRHRSVNTVADGENRGILEVTMDWLTPSDEVLLQEDTRFIFRARPEMRIIDRITTLTAQEDSVDFEDSKEGMNAIRVRRELEHPDEGALTVITEKGIPSDEPVQTNEGVTGEYLSSEETRGTDVWGTRAHWVRLSGVVDTDSVAVAIIDHPENVGYPTYWHARGYGLFSANPLGQIDFTDGAEEMNFSLAPGESTTFRYRLVVHANQLSPEELELLHDDFAEVVE